MSVFVTAGWEGEGDRKRARTFAACASSLGASFAVAESVGGGVSTLRSRGIAELDVEAGRSCVHGAPRCHRVRGTRQRCPKRRDPASSPPFSHRRILSHTPCSLPFTNNLSPHPPFPPSQTIPHITNKQTATPQTKTISLHKQTKNPTHAQSSPPAAAPP